MEVSLYDLKARLEKAMQVLLGYLKAFALQAFPTMYKTDYPESTSWRTETKRVVER